MIPKIIHYCWFGRNPLPELAQKCIASWKKYLPDYEIKEWNEDNFDVNIIPYTAEAYAMKKYAFVSDYARFWILYRYGGIYFDTDVEVIRPIDDIIAKGNFMGYETDPNPKRGDAGSVAPGHIATKVLCDNGLKNVTGIQEVDGCYIYPAEFFCPINVTTGRIHVEKNTRTIHHYAGTWVDKKFSLKEVVKRIIPEKLLLALFGLKAKLKNK